MDKKTLIKIIKIVSGKENVLPVLDNILFQDGKLYVTDLDTSVCIDTDFKVNGLVDIQGFCNALESIEDAKVKQVDKSKLQVYNNELGEIITLASDQKNIGDFPHTKRDGQKLAGTISEKMLPMVIRAGTFVGTDDLRPAMQGVHIKDYVCATDAHRLYWKKLDKPFKHAVLLNKKAVRILGLLEGDYKARVGSESYSLVGDGIEISGRHESTKYPDFLKVTEKKATTTMTMDKKELMAVLKKTDKFTNKYTHQVKFSLNDKVVVSAEDLDLDQSYSKLLNAKKEGEELEIGLNARFVLHAIGEVDSDEIKMEFQGSTQAVHINDDIIVMPVMLNEHIKS